MTQQGVLIRGNTQGITVYLNENVDFQIIIEEIKDKFTNANDFFKGASIVINSGSRNISPDEKMALIDLCQDFELAGVEFVSQPLLSRQKETPPQANEGDTLILKKTIRSGQKVSYPGNVVVIGDINPGAEVIASGDIVVMGHLRGVVHAGAQGNTEAEVFAQSLQPTQLRIAHCIARSPDGHLVKKTGIPKPEKAQIKEGLIILEGIED